MLLSDQRVAGHAAPGRNIGPRAGVARSEQQELPRFHCLHAQAKLEYEITAAEIARIPLGVYPSVMQPHDAVSIRPRARAPARAE
jgi:hypothetical protein